MPLDNFTKTFLDNDQRLNLRKGFFPHFFNKEENQEYEGPPPPQDTYGCDTMPKVRYQKCETWYSAQCALNYVFKLKDELISYCESDVRHLKAGCLAFRNEFQQLTSFDPFIKATIASACSLDLRMNRLSPNTIATEPARGWRLPRVIP